MSPSIASKVLTQFRNKAAQAEPAVMAVPTAPSKSATPAVEAEALSSKEERILDLIAQGQSNKQIAAVVFQAEGTVKNCVSRIMEKLHARNRSGLAMRAVRRRP